MDSGHHGDSWTNKPAMHDDRVSPLSDHKIMLIRPQQALLLASNNTTFLIFNNIFKTLVIQASLSDIYQDKEEDPYFFFLCHIFARPSYLTHCRSLKLALLHRIKERKTPSLSAQATFAPFSLKVAWSGKSLIGALDGGPLMSHVKLNK